MKNEFLKKSLLTINYRNSSKLTFFVNSALRLLLRLRPEPGDDSPPEAQLVPSSTDSAAFDLNFRKIRAGFTADLAVDEAATAIRIPT